MTDSTTGEPMGDSRAGIFRFTDLAAETRNQIYSLIATGDGKVYNLATFTAPAIARVSTQLRSESLPIIFAEASFYVNICSNLDDRATTRVPQLFVMNKRYLKFGQAKLSGTLRMKRPVKDILRALDKDAIFRNISFRIFDVVASETPNNQNIHSSAHAPRDCISVLKFEYPKKATSVSTVNWRRHPMASEEATRIYPARTFFRPLPRPSGGVVGGFGLNIATRRRWNAEDVKMNTDLAEATAHEIESREGFIGLSLRDLEIIARCFRAPQHVKQPVLFE